MDKIITAMFNSLNDAKQGAQIFDELAREGILMCYGYTIVKYMADDTVEVVKVQERPFDCPLALLAVASQHKQVDALSIVAQRRLAAFMPLILTQRVTAKHPEKKQTQGRYAVVASVFENWSVATDQRLTPFVVGLVQRLPEEFSIAPLLQIILQRYQVMEGERLTGSEALRSHHRLIDDLDQIERYIEALSELFAARIACLVENMPSRRFTLKADIEGHIMMLQQTLAKQQYMAENVSRIIIQLRSRHNLFLAKPAV